jgi:hypothetical protein
LQLLICCYLPQTAESFLNIETRFAVHVVYLQTSQKGQPPVQFSRATPRHELMLDALRVSRFAVPQMTVALSWFQKF